MKKSATLFTLALAGTLVAAPLAAQAQANAARLQKLNDALTKRFNAADANGDGKLSHDEAKAKMPRVYDSFDDIDTSGQGYVTLQQLKQYLASQAAERRNGGAN